MPKKTKAAKANKAGQRRRIPYYIYINGCLAMNPELPKSSPAYTKALDRWLFGDVSMEEEQGNAKLNPAAVRSYAVLPDGTAYLGHMETEEDWPTLVNEAAAAYMLVEGEFQASGWGREDGVGAGAHFFDWESGDLVGEVIFCRPSVAYVQGFTSEG